MFSLLYGQYSTSCCDLIACVELIILTLHLDQLVMCSALYDPALFQDHDAVRIADRRQPVGNDKGRTSLHQGIHSFGDDALSSGIDGTGRLIQDQCRRICNRSSGDRQQLPLALGQVAAVSGQFRLIAILQLADKTVCAGQLRGRNDLFIGRIQFAVADIFHDRPGKQMSILKYHAQRPAQVILADLIDIDVIVPDLAVVNIIEPVDQIGDGCLARTRRSDKGDLLTGLRIQAHCHPPDAYVSTPTLRSSPRTP